MTQWCMKDRSVLRTIGSMQDSMAIRASMPALGRQRFDWLTPPVLNRFTRVAAELDAGTGRLTVQGWHGDAPQTRVLELAG